MTSPLSPEARALVNALQNDRPDEDARARMRARLLSASAVAASTVLASAAASQASAMTGTSATGAVVGKTLSIGLATKLCVAGLVVSIGAASLLHVATEPASRTERAEPARSATRASASTGQTGAKSSRGMQTAQGTETEQVSESARMMETAPVTLNPIAETARAAQITPLGDEITPLASAAPARVSLRSRRVRAAASARHKEPVVFAQSEEPASSLSYEQILLARALQALRDGDPTEARAQIARHEQLFPHGALAPERERIKQRTTCANVPCPKQGEAP
jgi:hypothetical protein